MITCIFDINSKKPKYEQLYIAIREQIEKGILNPEEKLPSKRKLSEHLEISTITVEASYNQLLSEGYIYSVPKSGYYVQKFDKSVIAVKKPKFIPSYEEDKKEEFIYDFRTNTVDTGLFPFSLWAKTARAVLCENRDDLLNKTHPQGLLDLRNEISDHLYKFRGMTVSPDKIIIGSGSEYLMEMIIKILGRDRIYAIENPGYRKIYRILKENQIRTIPVPLDTKGADVSILEQSDAGVIHITPSHQFPTGIVMPVKRRSELLNWANGGVDRYIIEDDYDSEFRFRGHPVQSLQRLDGEKKVIYMNSFSKSIAPSFRVGYMVLPEELMKIYKKEYMHSSPPVSNFEQYILYRFMKSRMFERHLMRMKKVYRERRDIFLASVKKYNMEKYTRVIGYDAGLHLILKVENAMDENTLVLTAKKEGIRVYGISEYYSFPDESMPDNTLVIGYSGLEPEKIEAAVKKLSEIWK